MSWTGEQIDVAARMNGCVELTCEEFDDPSMGRIGMDFSTYRLLPMSLTARPTTTPTWFRSKHASAVHSTIVPFLAIVGIDSKFMAKSGTYRTSPIDTTVERELTVSVQRIVPVPIAWMA